MRPILQNYPQIAALSQALADSLTALVSAIKTGWNKQHNGDGTHDAVTANSIVVSNLASLGRLRARNIVEYVNLGAIPTARLDNLTTPGIENATVLKITIFAFPITLTGIDSTGRVPGDLLLLINNDQIVGGPGDIVIAAFDTNSVISNRFIGSAASTTPWTLNGSQGIWLMYDSYTNTGATPFYGWRVITRS